MSARYKYVLFICALQVVLLSPVNFPGNFRQVISYLFIALAHSRFGKLHKRKDYISKFSTVPACSTESAGLIQKIPTRVIRKLV